jgi:MFS transporter, MHS family, citrate/tricarballylate:H+ symporter
MGFSIVGLALTPSYATIGIAAPLLVVVFRLLQGFALGGEVGPSSAFLMEAAPSSRRGLYVALQFSTQQLAMLAAGLVGFILASVMSVDALTQWGWRIAFLIGALLVPFGLFVRNRLPETLHRLEPTQEVAQLQPRIILFGLLMMAAATMAAPPSFMAMAVLKTGGALLATAALMAVLLALALPAMLVSLMESLSSATRSGGIGTLYALTISIFGGTAQFAVHTLINVTGSPLAPGWYMSGALLLGLAGMIGIRETVPIKLG